MLRGRNTWKDDLRHPGGTTGQTLGVARRLPEVRRLSALHLLIHVLRVPTSTSLSPGPEVK